MLGLSILLCSGKPLVAEDNTTDQVIYIKSGSDTFAATLVPDQTSGTVLNDPALVEVATNAEPAAFQLVPGSGGQLDLSGRLPELEDGRYRGTVKTFTPDGGLKDHKQLLFMVDSKPPLIERVAPEDDFFPRTAGSIRFRITDTENGSGVSIDPVECGLRVVVDGANLRKSLLSFEDNELNLFVFIAFPGGAAEHNAIFTVSVAMQDRAGNIGRTIETFRIRSLAAPAFQIYQCNYGESYTQKVGEFLVESSYSGLTLKAGAGRTLDIFTRGCFGKGFQYPEKVRELIRKGQGIDKQGEPEIVTMNPFFQKAVADLIEIQSTSENIAVRKLEDGDFEDSRISFRITQNRPAPMGNQAAALLMTIPVAFRLDPSGVDFCASKNQVDPNKENDHLYHHIPEDAFAYTFETVTIPVFMEAAAAPFSLRVAQEDDQLAARVTVAPIELMDTGASWFEFAGEKHWFDQQGEACVARGPTLEGRVHYKIAAAHQIAEFSGLQGDSTASSRTLFNEGDIVVHMDPPVIEDFRYDREKNTLHAAITDQGTPLDELAFELRLAGYRLEADFNPATGELTAVLPYTPISVMTASLRVTDLAEQTTTGHCQIFGEAEPDEDTEDSDSSIRGPYTDTPNVRGIDKVIGTTGKGKALVEICEDVMMWGYFENGRFTPIDSPPGSIRLVQLRSRDPGNVEDSNAAISNHLPLHLEIFGESYDTRRYEPIPARAGGVTSLSVTGNRTSSGAGRAFYFVVMARNGNKTIPIHNTGFGFGLPFKFKQTQQCRVEERDILAPVIHPVFDPAMARLTATIHDHGMPLSELAIELTARGDSTRNIAGWGHHLHSTGGRPAFTFQNGVLTSRFVPPPRGEFFTFQITAEDKAGNRGSVYLDVMIPREPPEVSLEAQTQQTRQIISRYGEKASAFMTAEAKDDSQIVAEQTTLWLDNQVLRPFTMYSHTKEAGWRSLFNFKAGYVAGVEEGPHLARFRATDATGLWAEAMAAFDFQLAPFISNFKVMPDAVRKIGGPALTAMVIDPGGNLDISGLALTIDGQSVDTSRLFYDAASGYFSVDGPLELAEGSHVAEITAKDSHGNQASDSLRFTRAMEITTPYQRGDQGLVIDGLTLMELENHNGDGRANPGELVRLFVALRNDTEDVLACAGRLSSEDLDIAVETESVAYGGMEPGSTLVPMYGFELRIDSDILEKTINDPYQAYFHLTLGCEEGQEWVLPLTIPIHQPSIPIGTGMAVTLDRLPPTTRAGTFRLQGTVTSNAEFIDGMEVRVNGALQGPVVFNREGGRFEVTVTLADGANTIEVTGMDSNGVRGSASGYIFRATVYTPPSISITSPSSGDYFVCGNLTVTGTYSTGSGTLNSIAVDGPWGMGNCPVTIIDDTNFSVDCGDVISGPSGIYDIEATVETTDGVQSVDTITISVGSCT